MVNSNFKIKSNLANNCRIRNCGEIKGNSRNNKIKLGKCFIKNCLKEIKDILQDETGFKKMSNSMGPNAANYLLKKPLPKKKSNKKRSNKKRSNKKRSNKKRSNKKRSNKKLSRS